MTTTATIWMITRSTTDPEWWWVYREGFPNPVYKVNDEKAAADLATILNAGNRAIPEDDTDGND